jgi:GDP-mannose 6-dehydrogenase
MRISVFGLGYVGTVSSACFAELGHTVVGVDLSKDKVELINAGRSPVVEERVQDLISATVAAGALRATMNAHEAVASTDVSLISVGTPSQPNGAQSLAAVKAVSAEIGEAIKTKSGAHTVILRSTVPPGTTDDIVLPILERASGRKAGDGLAVGFNPEFLREGSSVRDFYEPELTVIGAVADHGAAEMAALYEGISAPVIRTSCRIAESVKYLSNVWHAVKVTFANEAGSILKSLGVDSRAAMDIFFQDKRLNISSAYLRPGFAFGGSCLPKDLRALLALGRDKNLDTPMLGHVAASNNSHIDRAFEMIANHGKRNVAMFGVAFKPGTDDLRESPYVGLAERLIGRGYSLRLYDPYVIEARLIGSNKDYIAREVPHFDKLLVADAERTLAGADVIVIGHVGPRETQTIAAHHGGRKIIDLQGVQALRTLAGVDYEGMCW